MHDVVVSLRALVEYKAERPVLNFRLGLHTVSD